MTLYIYDESSGTLKHSLSGAYEAIVLNITTDEDFTLTPPPNTYEAWRWIDDKWIADNTAE